MTTDPPRKTGRYMFQDQETIFKTYEFTPMAQRFVNQLLQEGNAVAKIVATIKEVYLNPQSKYKHFIDQPLNDNFCAFINRLQFSNC